MVSHILNNVLKTTDIMKLFLFLYLGVPDPTFTVERCVCVLGGERARGGASRPVWNRLRSDLHHYFVVLNFGPEPLRSVYSLLQTFYYKIIVNYYVY